MLDVYFCRPCAMRASTRFLWGAGLALALNGCGGGGGSTTLGSDTLISDEVFHFTLEVPAQSSGFFAHALVQPNFHLAPVQLEAPGNADQLDVNASAHLTPRTQTLPTHVTAQSFVASTERLALQNLAPIQPYAVAPMATGSAITTYTPAQIRAAYGLPALPANISGLAPEQAAQLGAGQTIYVVDAMHNPNVVAELAAFNQQFGLPGCTHRTLSSAADLPLPAPPSDACELVVGYTTASGVLTLTPPAYNEAWATEIAMDVQWAHATAPLARIVLIEAESAAISSLLGSIRLVNSMGPGMVSMSFGAQEGSWTASVDAVFNTPNMSYLAASGDSGAGVMWPAVSSRVLAVGGTSLTYNGTGARSEVSWSGSGGGSSLYTAAPAYQSNAVPGMGTVNRRNVPDVALNADPSTGQYLALMPPGSTTVRWASGGGTSISAPQWAGVLAIANATRALSAKAPLSTHAALYGQVAALPSTYTSSFADITLGSNGSCITCAAKTGFDTVTGLGTPHVTSLVGTLSGMEVLEAPPPATLAGPVVTVPPVAGAAGRPVSAAINFAAPGASYVVVAISGVPRGMSFSASGLTITAYWSNPSAGNFRLKIDATDSEGRLTQATLPMTVTAQ